jgi:hypothetical protein
MRCHTVILACIPHKGAFDVGRGFSP